MSHPTPPPSTQGRNARSPLDPGAVILILGLLVGLLYCAFIPFGAGFDEETHILRIYDLSGLNLLPNRGPDGKTVGFSEFFTLSYQRRYFESPAFDLFGRENFLKTPDYDSMAITETRSIYSPAVFLPQAALAGVFWRFLELPVIPVSIVLRAAGFLVYLAAAFITARLLPQGKWVFAVLALSPMALFQAATLNADGFTNAASFLFIGLALHLHAAGPESARPRLVWALAVAVALLGLAKPGYVALLPLLLLVWQPLRKANGGANKLALLGAAAALAVVFTAGWALLSVPQSHFAAGGSQSLSRQLGVIAADPGGFILAYITGAFASILPYFRDWTAAYGYWVGVVPEPVFWLYPLALLAALAAEPRNERYTLKARLITLGVFIVAAAAILFMFFYVHYEPGTSSDLGQQGRYFIPVAPLFFIPLSGLAALKDGARRAARALSAALLVAALGFYSLGMYAAYYNECGYAAVAGRSCVLPVYKNIEKVNAPLVTVDASTSAAQTFTNTCGERLQGVDVLVNAVGSRGSGTLRYSLLDGGGRVLAAQDVPLDRIAAQKPLVLKMDEGLDLPEGIYEIRLEAVGFGPGESVGLALRPEEVYPGSLTVAGRPAEGDLIFHYICANPWR